MSGAGRMALAFLMSGAVAGRAQAGETAGTAAPWTPEQGTRLLERLRDREPFLGSREATRHPESLGHFFDRHEYERLRGNPVYGYWADDGFRWVGDRVAWDGITPVSPSARPIRAPAWDAAFAYIAKKYALAIDRRASVRIRGACVAAVVDPSRDEPNRGVVLELRIQSPTGVFWYRFGMGKPTLEDAIGASLEWAIGFARTVNRDTTGPTRMP